MQGIHMIEFAFWLLLIILAIVIYAVSKRLNFSKRKTIMILAALIIILVVLPLLWFEVIGPRWSNSIRAEIDAANYCSIDSDCVLEYFDGVTCGSYVNKNEVAQIYSDIKLYRLIDYGGCMGGALPPPKCENNKCVQGERK